MFLIDLFLNQKKKDILWQTEFLEFDFKDAYRLSLLKF